ncbi:hypothetical protein BASA61_000945 [Batrachochytrium salamandrivorans]|nr:hypothetical protein BASA61_000945 [Batrachochytrium salamandrivorans]
MPHLSSILIAALVGLSGVSSQVTGSNSLSDKTATDAALTQLCSEEATKNILACSIRASCKKVSCHSKDNTCSDATLLVTACRTDAAIASKSSACNIVTASCPNGSESSNSQCAPLGGLPATLTVQQNLFNACKAMKMDGCQDCAAPSSNATIANCNVMSVYSRICSTMPDMSNCQPYNLLCGQSPLPTALAAYCPAAAKDSHCSGEGIPAAFDDSAPLMQMYLHTGISDYVLFKTFVPTTNGQYAGAFIFSATLSVLFFCVSEFRRMRLAVHHAYRRSLNPTKSSGRSWNSKVEIYQMELAALRTIEVFIGYMVMLIVMTCNVGLIVAVMVGVFIGTYVLDRSCAIETQGTHCM